MINWKRPSLVYLCQVTLPILIINYNSNKWIHHLPLRPSSSGKDREGFVGVPHSSLNGTKNLAIKKKKNPPLQSQSWNVWRKHQFQCPQSSMLPLSLTVASLLTAIVNRVEKTLHELSCKSLSLCPFQTVRLVTLKQASNPWYFSNVLFENFNNLETDRPPIRYVYNRKGKRNILPAGS